MRLLNHQDRTTSERRYTLAPTAELPTSTNLISEGRWSDLSVISTVALLVWAVVIALSPRSWAGQTLSPFSEFQRLTPSELSTVQGKLSDVGSHERGLYTLAFAVTAHPVDLSVFQPFYRAAFQYKYGGDISQARTFDVSTQEVAALIDSVASQPEITDGGVHGYLSFSLSVVKDGTTKAFETIMDTTGSRLLFGKMMNVFAENQGARGAVTSYACALGLLPGPSMTDVTGQVSIR